MFCLCFLRVLSSNPVLHFVVICVLFRFVVSAFPFYFPRVRGVVLWPVGYMYVPVGTPEPTPLTTAFEVDASQMKLSLAPGVGDRK